MPKQLWTAITVCALITCLARAEERFRNTANLGVTLTDGNSETLLANIAMLSEARLSEGNTIRLGVEGNYGESTIDDSRQTTVENARAFMHARRQLYQDWFWGLNAGYQYDNIANIDYRLIAGPSIGGYLIKGDKLTLSSEIGPSYVWEKVAKTTDRFPVVRFAERITYKINETAELWQSAEFLPKTTQLDDFLLNAEMGASAAMSARIQLRIVLKLNHDSTPGENLEKNDFTLVSGIGMKL
jgi:putative salt-induced outer membrane protein